MQVIFWVKDHMTKVVGFVVEFYSTCSTCTECCKPWSGKLWHSVFLKQDAQGLLEESRSLEKKVYLASEAQKAAKDVEQDYAEVRVVIAS